MQRVGAAESHRQPATDRGAEGSAPRSTPLTLVSGAIAGDDLERVTATVARALGCPVAIAIPALGAPVVTPPGALSTAEVAEVGAYAQACVIGSDPRPPPAISESVVVRIGHQVVGVALSARAGTTSDTEPADPIGVAERRAWLEAAAAAASITALIREAQNGSGGEDGAALLRELAGASPDDLAGFLARARHAGFDLAAGAIAVCAQGGDGPADGAPRATPGLLSATLSPGRLLALVPLHRETDAEVLAATLRGRGMTVALSAARRDPATLHDALREAELLLGLASTGVQLGEQDETYRLLIGVLLRDPTELRQLRERTISPLAEYDAGHDTELLATLQAFLAHDGSTTETAEAMTLHRHTVGYRLSRVHEVSGLSPYESDGRERLSLGLKAHQILEADARREL